MLIKSVKLNNIRSYTNHKLEFPPGSVLLSGDIGTGKSSILLAIEFALFGIRRVHLPGSALLRHEKKQGSVELKFEIDGKEVIINRNLKRVKDDVKQDAGYIIVDGRKRDLTPVELKSYILNLLGYPKELLSKSRDVIYRYTVYTPQEQMKQILLEEREVRLDTLRKVFNIDKYKRVKENTLVFTRHLRERAKNYEGKIADLIEKKKQLEAYEKELKESKVKIDVLKPKLKEAKELLLSKKKDVSRIEAGIKELVELKKELSMNEVNLKNKLEQRKHNNVKIEQLEKQIELLKKEVEGKETTALKKAVLAAKEKENQMGLMEKTIIQINSKISEFKTRKLHASETKEKISKLNICPLCKQEVTSEHKHNIVKKADEDASSFNEDILVHSKQLKEAESKISSLKEELNKLREKQQELSVVGLKLKNLVEKTKLMEEFAKMQDTIKKEIGKINMKKVELNEKAEAKKNIESDYIQLKKELEEFVENERNIAVKLAAAEKEHEDVNKVLDVLKKEIDEKTKIQEKLSHNLELRNWFDEYFIKLADVMEKHVMSRVHGEFNQFFTEWFNILIEDETLNVRLDDEFTPIVEQNGYETTIANLSGGEKTAVALAYRLALNKVINDIIHEIKTKDILMLDEPTDGFSTQQLDKVRDILNELGMKQIIIVSHETKIESFVDNVINIHKNEHVSGAS
ncbi:AAA family ATPase [Candidatus Woesearchaeota archaeon]|nr:AAA family ATPase [Candidatus Woesearchaeota archaeon]